MAGSVASPRPHRPFESVALTVIMASGAEIGTQLGAFIVFSPSQLRSSRFQHLFE